MYIQQADSIVILGGFGLGQLYPHKKLSSYCLNLA